MRLFTLALDIVSSLDDNNTDTLTRPIAMRSAAAFLGGTVLLQLGDAWSVHSEKGSQIILHPPPGAAEQDAQGILATLEAYPDPVDALVSLQPDAEEELMQARLLHILGEKEPLWKTEGDKLRLRGQGKKFIDLTDHHEFYAQQSEAAWAGKASTSGSPRRPCLHHTRGANTR